MHFFLFIRPTDELSECISRVFVTLAPGFLDQASLDGWEKFDYHLIILYYVILLCNDVLMSFTAEERITCKYCKHGSVEEERSL